MASGHTKVLTLRRSTMEAKLGPLQSVIDQAGVRIAKGEAMKEKDESLVASLQVLQQVVAPTSCNIIQRVPPTAPKTVCFSTRTRTIAPKTTFGTLNLMLQRVYNPSTEREREMERERERKSERERETCGDAVFLIRFSVSPFFHFSHLGEVVKKQEN